LSADGPKRRTPILLPTPLTIEATKPDADSDGLGTLTIAGFSCQTRRQGHWHKTTNKTEAFAINAEISGGP
jgi:hypothetical protein